MNKIVLSVLIFLFSMNGFAQDGVKFMEGNFQEALNVARQQKKMVFVDVYTSWCGPCRWMSEEVLQTPEAATYFDKHFVCFKIDAEKGDGVEFAKKYDVHAYPTFLMFLPDGTLQHKVVGADTLKLFIPAKRENIMEISNGEIRERNSSKKRDSGSNSSVRGGSHEERSERGDRFAFSAIVSQREIEWALLGGLRAIEV